MRTIEDMRPQLSVLGRVLEKYARISKMAFDFGVGELLHPSEIHVVCFVAETGQASVSDIAESFGNTKGAASQVVSKLVKKKLLTRTPDPAKKSRAIVAVTAKGQTAHENHLAFHMQHDKPFFDYLSTLNEEQYQSFESLCGQMDSWMKSYFVEPDE